MPLFKRHRSIDKSPIANSGLLISRLPSVPLPPRGRLIFDMADAQVGISRAIRYSGRESVITPMSFFTLRYRAQLLAGEGIITAAI